MYKALIIGCGNIGAMYDFENELILTYAKAFHIDPEVSFAVHDINHHVAEKVAQRYSVQALKKLEPEIFSEFDIISICTPTHTHYDYLCKMLVRGPKLVICEKPVDSDLTRLDNILSLYRKSCTKVMVNFFRPFQPGIVQLRNEINNLIAKERCTNIVVSYQRGFHNNASHAIDLLEFIFGLPFDLSAAIITHTASDEFDTDPTMSVSCFWNNASVQFVGLANVEFSHFDIAIYFIHKAVLLKDGSNRIEWHAITPKKGNFYSKLKLQSKRTDVMENYMKNVVSHAKLLLKDNEQISNFVGSVSISQQILKLQGR